MRNWTTGLMILMFTGVTCAGGNWPQFRGPNSNGTTDATDLPLSWSESENVTWKTTIHDRGWSSPVIHNQQIWLTTATEKGHELFAIALDLSTGKILHDIKVFEVANPNEINSLNSYASPTPVVEPGRVYVHFGTYGTACLETASGKVLWKRQDLPCFHMVGPGSSPILYENLLIFHMDGGEEQYVVALDKKTGKTVWKSNRSVNYQELRVDFRKAFCTPLILNYQGQQQMISVGAQAVMAYEPLTGKEIWQVRFKGFSNTARPVTDNKMIFISTGFNSASLLAIRLGGKGDVTESHIAWTQDKDVPIKPSPILTDGLLYMVSDNGKLSCIEAATGEVIWSDKISGQYSASPILAQGRIYFFNQSGKTTVIAAGKEFKVLSTNDLDQGFMASPAVDGNALILRSKTHLYRIEK
ncbi:MAG: PQQ-binding-like beta-propeller repeat protein [Sedimentisphaerales bacterium]|nr:PQQ-binding-like beta-propeller repeat protein [Sedimentisphaerales bacterium]